ncbi:MAG: lactonase family protein, partial [Acidovorax sp.]|nr:lactonase family protein [Acidovorax sp.]
MATDTLVFVSCADSGELHVLRLASDSGQLRTEQVLALGGQLMPMALSP